MSAPRLLVPVSEAVSPLARCCEVSRVLLYVALAAAESVAWIQLYNSNHLQISGTCSHSCWAGLGPGAERDYIVLLLCLPTLASVLVLLSLASTWRRAHGLQHPATAAILCILLVSIPSPIFL